MDLSPHLLRINSRGVSLSILAMTGCLFVPTHGLCQGVAKGTTVSLLWEIKTKVDPRKGTTDRVADLTYSPDGKWLAAAHGGFACELLIIDPETGRVVRSLDHKPEGNTFGLNAVDFSSDGKYLATGGSNGHVTIWDTDTWSKSETLHVPSKDTIWDIEFSRDDSRLFAGTHSGVGVWNASNWKLLDMTRHGASKIAVSPGGEFLALNGAAKILSTTSSELIKQAGEHGDSVVDFTPSGLLATSPSTDRVVAIYDIEKRTVSVGAGGRRGPYEMHIGYYARRITASPDDRMLAMGERESGVVALACSNHSWRFPVMGSSDDGLDAPPPGFTGSRFLGPVAKEAVLLNDGETLAVAKWGQPGTAAVYFWDVASGELINIVRLPGDRQSHAVAIAPNGKIIAHFSAKDVELIDRASGAVVRTLQGTNGSMSLDFVGEDLLLCGGHGLFSLDGKKQSETPIGNSNSVEVSDLSDPGLFAVEGNGVVEVWSSASAKVKDIALSSGTAMRIIPAISPDGRWLISYYENDHFKAPGRIDVYDLLADKLTTSISTAKLGIEWVITALSFSANGEVVSASGGENVMLLDPSSAQPIAKWTFPEQRVIATNFSLDGKIVFITTADGTTRVLPIDLRMKMETWSAHCGTVEAVCFHPVKDVIVSSGEDGIIKAWDISTIRRFD